MITFKDWLYFLIIAKSSLLLASKEFSFRLEKDSIQVGESTFLTLEIPKTGVNYRPVLLDDPLQQNKEIKLLERSLRENSDTWVVSYELTAHEAQKITLPAIQVQLGPDLFSTESQQVEVSTSRAEDDLELRPEFGELASPFPWRLVYLGLVWLFSIGVGLWFLRWLLSKVIWKRLFKYRFQLPRWNWTNHRAWLRNRLNEIENKISNGENSGELVDEVDHAFKDYMERKTLQPVLSWTAKELSLKLSRRHLKNLSGISLVRAEASKYSSFPGNEPGKLAQTLINEIRRALKL